MIITNQLTRYYGKFKAVDNLNLTIEAGESYGFLGPNGAGKTTTLMMILGILKPSAGDVTILGKRLSQDFFRIKRQIGVVAEYQNFYEEMTAWEYLMFFGRLFEVDGAEKRARRLLERLSLWQWRDVLVGGYSTGMQRKLGFARALLHSPAILVLDEPVSGLDPFGIVQVREILLEEHAAGTTILISSHILSEVERTASRVGIISKGQLIFEGSMDELKQETNSRRQIELELLAPGAEILAALRALPFVVEVAAAQPGGSYLIDTLGDRDYRPELGLFLADRRVVVQGMRAIEASLEQAFITISEAHVRQWTSSQAER